MVFRLFTMYDVVACEAGPIWQAKSLPVAQRQVRNQMVANRYHVEDYKLLYLGTFDSETMVFHIEERPSECEIVHSDTSEELVNG